MKSTVKKRSIFLKFDFHLYLFLLVAFPSSALSQASGTFTATGSMNTARTRHTATLLRDGRVLIAGGQQANAIGKLPGDAVATAELYNLGTGTFTATGNMTVARAGHSAVLLNDGRVLIIGGAEAGTSATAELYDPSTGAFTATGNMVNTQLTATLLGNGKALMAGGLTGVGPYSVVRAELYDPSTGTFIGTGSYAGTGSSFYIGGPAEPTATLLSDGRVLIAGEPTAELYDPVAGTFSLTGAMVTSRDFGGALGVKPLYIAGRTATLLTNGKVLLAGGEHEDLGAFANAELYDPSTGAFTATSDMRAVRSGHTATLLTDGTVLITGGESVACPDPFCSFVAVASAELYNPSLGTFGSVGNMTTRREGHTATVLNDGRVLIAGGFYFSGAASSCCLDSAELYIPPASVLWQQAVTAMKTAAGTDSLNFWQWAYYWQNAPAFAGAPNGFGVSGSISPDMMDQITKAGGGNVLLNISAEQWVLYYRQATCAGCWDY